MATKSIIDIDVNDEQFKRFFALFEQYDSKVKDMPEHWKKLNEATNGGAAAIGAAVSVLLEPLNRSADAALEISRNLEKASKAQEQFRKSTHQSENGLKKMGKQAKEVAHTIFGIGKFVLKAGTIGTGLFAGGVFGLDRLAESAVGSQRSALGMGLTTGQLRAFRTDLGRYLDPSILSSVARQQSDYAGRVWLSRATGLSTSQIEGMNAGDISAQLAIKAHEWWKSTPAQARTIQNLQATGFTQAGLSLEDIKRLGATPLSQLRAAQSQYAKDSLTLNITKANTNALYDFARKLTLAGQKLETAFTNKLAALGPSLGNFINSLEKDAEILLNGILTPQNLKKVETGLTTFANYLGSPSFRKDISSFVEGFQTITNVIAKASSIIHPDKKATKDDWSWRYFLGSTWLGNKAADLSSKIQSGDASFAKPGSVVAKWLQGYAHMMGRTTLADKISQSDLFARMDAAKGLPRGTTHALASVESNFNPGAVSSKGAQGLMQLMPQVSKNLGVQDPMNWIQSLMGGATLFQQLQARYHGDFKKELAAWNWNPTSVDKDVATYGNDWMRHVPRETQNFISRVLKAMQRDQQRPAKVVITNKSGTNVAISTNAAGI